MNRIMLGVSTIMLAISVQYLLKTEIIPYLEYSSIPSIKNLLVKYTTPVLIERDIYLGKSKKGSSLYYVIPTKTEVIILNEIRLDIGDAARSVLTRSGITIPISVNVFTKTRLVVDKSGKTKEMTTYFSFGGVSYTIRGEPIDDNRFRFDVDLINKRHSVEVDLTSEDILAMNEYSTIANCGKPYVGKKWKMKGFKFDPMNLRPSMIDYFAVIDKLEVVRLLDRKEQLFRIEIRERLTDKIPLAVAYANSDGDVICEEFSSFNISYYSYLTRTREPSPEEIKKVINND